MLRHLSVQNYALVQALDIEFSTGLSVITGESGAGMVKITMTCKHEVRGLEIDDSLVGDDKEMLEDLIIAAFNDAVRRVEKTTKEKFSGMTAGLSLPPGMKLPF